MNAPEADQVFVLPHSFQRMYNSIVVAYPLTYYKIYIYIYIYVCMRGIGKEGKLWKKPETLY